MITVGRSSDGMLLDSFKTQSRATSPPSHNDNISLRNTKISTELYTLYSEQHTQTPYLNIPIQLIKMSLHPFHRYTEAGVGKRFVWMATHGF